MKNIKLLYFALLILLFSGCSSSSQLNPITLLTGNPWALSSMMGGSLDLSKFPSGIPTLNFLDGGKLAGFAGCNNFSGGFSMENSGLQLDPGAMTRMACPGTGEDEFMDALVKVKNFKVTKDKLTLLDGANELMSFVPKKD
ncbi:heat shock protein HslJ [Algoriphagus boseongensis]|uniref:Heat shock protein HslJ n=1 Tax=Algoriphagus boseongensis TaxID=1442587 RepID=A0A4R6T999_9BACT|nr:META domain-containing protein [Algoriphagus boseongensis]TDQ17558.1 heat shock protein HslJ [Algoriphagus boseongensis]